MFEFKYLFRPINIVTINIYKNYAKLGYCSLNKNYLYNFNIYENYRGNGYSTILLNHAKDLNFKNYTNLQLHVEKSNQIALNLYLKNGFKKKTTLNDIVLLEHSIIT